MHLKIAICDDAPADLKTLRAALDDYLDAVGIRAGVKCFSHPDELLKAAEAECFDLYLLDMMMPMMDGVGVARELQERQESAVFVYFTSSAEKAIEAIGVRPAAYVLKPWTQDQFDEALDKAVVLVRKIAADFVTFKTQEGVCRVVASEILCVTRSKTANCKDVCLQDGRVISVRLTLDAIAAILAPFGTFFADGRYALVNPHRVVSVSGTEVRFDGGKTLTIHRASIVPLARAVAALPW